MIKPELQRPTGTQDILAPQSWRVEKFRRIALDVAKSYGFDLIETPIFEQSGVFLKVGESTDIVQHERYAFTDAGGDDLTLRPEGTAAVARAYIQNGLYNLPKPLKLIYWGPMFRRERPQAERYRQHTQFGAELYGSEAPLADIEIILLACRVVERAGLQEPDVRINSIGCNHCRPAYRKALVDYYAARRTELCQDCQSRLNKNPLRLLDCKVDVAIKDAAPDLGTFWCDACRSHIEAVMNGIAVTGRPVRRDPFLVRGLDYYTRTVFEVGHPSLGQNTALFGGGRYDGLTGALGGADAPAVGFGMGIERMLSAIGPSLIADNQPGVYVANLPGFQMEAIRLAESLRAEGFSADYDLVGRSLKAQLRDASRRSAIVVMIGGEEWDRGVVEVKSFATGEQQAIGRHDLENYLRHHLESGNHPGDGGITA